MYTYELAKLNSACIAKCLNTTSKIYIFLKSCYHISDEKAVFTLSLPFVPSLQSAFYTWSALYMYILY